MRANPEPSDGDLVIAARAGDGAALGLLLARHRPRLLASALRLLGYRADAEDAVQETFLAALRHLDAVREPAAVGAWLHAVLRRACLQHRRRPDALRTDALVDVIDVVDASAGPDERLERADLRDWIWGALQRIPEPLRVAAMLRYFGSYDSYDELAAILGVPVGTVRSRLSEVRRKLSDALLAGRLDDGSRARWRARERCWLDAFDDIVRRGASDPFVSLLDPELLVAWSSGATARGRHHVAAEIESDIAAGVRLVAERALTTDGVTVVEGRFVNPPEDPTHCPPGIALVLFGGGRDDRASRVHLHLAPRAPRPDD
jgi:RNA polymerase sigma-70 factor (ECF subfamily)